MCRSIGAVCLASLLLRTASAAACPTFPEGSFQAAAARQAVGCVSPTSISSVSQSVGGVVLSNLGLLSSSGATCGASLDELKAKVLAGQGQITIGLSTCSLDSVVVKKSDATPNAAVTMRLDFTGCTAGPSTASVNMNVAKGPDNGASMMPFWHQVCTKQTTTPSSSTAAVKLQFNETVVGNGTCKGDALKSGLELSRHDCKMMCTALVEQFASSLDSLESQGKMCKGYSWSSTSTDPLAKGTCNLFKSNEPTITEVVPVAKGEPGAFCWSLKAGTVTYQESTPAPPTAAQLAADEARLPKLNVTVLATSASVLTFQSPTACYTPFNWITLEDDAQQTVSVSVRQSEWAEFLELIPSDVVRRLDGATSLEAIVFADRANYGAPPPVTVAPVAGGTAAPAGPPTAAPCPQAPAEGVSMAWTWILFLLVLASAGGSFYYGKWMAATFAGASGMVTHGDAKPLVGNH